MSNQEFERLDREQRLATLEFAVSTRSFTVHSRAHHAYLLGRADGRAQHRPVWR